MKDPSPLHSICTGQGHFFQNGVISITMRYRYSQRAWHFHSEKRWLSLAKPLFISHTPQGCRFENINILQFFELFSVLMSSDNILEIFILLTVYGLISHLLTITVFSFHILQWGEVKEILLFYLQSTFYKSKVEFA